MITFIVQYWLEIIFGLIATGTGFLAKKFYSLYKKEQEHIKQEEDNTLKDSINQEVLDIIQDHKQQSQRRNEHLQKQINCLETDLDILRDGILCIQGKSFKTDCHKLLKEDHEITSKEWDMISSEHDTYNSLGGNHDGDRLYEDVQIKYHNNL